MTEATRPLWQIQNDLARLRQEKKAARSAFTHKPGIRSRSFRPEGPGQRQPRERDNGHLAFIRCLPCVACYAVGRSDAAHLRMADVARGKRYTGKGEKPSDCWTTPLCRDCHTRQHSGSEAAFWSALNIDPVDLCRALYAASGDEYAARQAIASARTGRAA